jgi:hypothetical protein
MTDPVSVGVAVFRTGHAARIRVVKARVAHITQVVAVRVLLKRIERQRAVVVRAGVDREPGIAPPVVVAVRTEIARVTDEVPVEIVLSRVGKRRAIVIRAGVVREARIPEAVAVRIGADVACVAVAVTVEVPLQRIEDVRAVVVGETDPVPVVVVARVAGAGVAGIAEAVAIAVELTRIRDLGTVVVGTGVQGEPGIAPPIAVGVGAEVASVAHPVVVEVVLGHVVVRGAVVTRVPDGVAIAVRLGGVRDDHTVVVDIHDAVVVEVLGLTHAGIVVRPFDIARIRAERALAARVTARHQVVLQGPR